MANGLKAQGNGRPLEGGLIGTRTRRYGGVERATGAQKYVADLDFPGVLAVAIVSIPVGCADILAVDTHAAEAMPGVVKVLTAADLPSPMPRFGVSHKDRPVMASTRVNFYGEPVAAVAAAAPLVSVTPEIVSPLTRPREPNSVPAKLRLLP